MNTPWGDIEVCDAHVHFFSHNFFTILGRQRDDQATAESTCSIIGWPPPPEQPEDLAAQWVDELDRHAVSRASLIASMPGDEHSVARAVAAFPHRFHGYFFFNPLAPNSLETLRAALDKGLQGVCFFPAMHGYSIADTRVRPALDVLRGRPGVAAFVHSGVLSVGVRKQLGLSSLFDMRYSNPIDLHPVALRYPDVPFIVPHFGAGFLREVLIVSDLCDNVYIDTSSSNAWLKYQQTAMTLDEVFSRVLDVAGPSRVLFGTDSSFFPRGWHAAIFQQQSEILDRMGLSAPDASAILGGNLLRLMARDQNS